ncbi:MAG: hypothetical protein AAFP84_21085, partial [Actinomycetota bacterium]
MTARFEASGGSSTPPRAGRPGSTTSGAGSTPGAGTPTTGRRTAGAATRLRPQRRLERGAIWAFLPVLAMLPFSVLTLAIVWLPLRLAFGMPFWWVLLAFAATGPLLFLRPFQVAVLTPVLGARAPTASESASIAPRWADVVRAAGDALGAGRTRYVVRILPSDELNAFACGGHLVVVTSYAVE